MNTGDSDISPYQTKDLHLAAGILAHGGELSTVEWRGRVAWFQFNSPDRCRDLESDYWGGRLTVVALRYSESMRTLKMLLFSAQDDKGDSYEFQPRHHHR